MTGRVFALPSGIQAKTSSQAIHPYSNMMLVYYISFIPLKKQYTMILSLFVFYQVRKVDNLTQKECMTECDGNLLDVSSVSYFLERQVF